MIGRLGFPAIQTSQFKCKRPTEKWEKPNQKWEI